MLVEQDFSPTLDLDMPKVRWAMILHLKDRDSKITVREGLDVVFLDCEIDGYSARTAKLTIPEVRSLTDSLNRACRKITTRPKYRP